MSSFTDEMRKRYDEIMKRLDNDLDKEYERQKSLLQQNYNDTIKFYMDQAEHYVKSGNMLMSLFYAQMARYLLGRSGS
jgi:hypothetical protein